MKYLGHTEILSSFSGTSVFILFYGKRFRDLGYNVPDHNLALGREFLGELECIPTSLTPPGLLLGPRDTFM